jgi:4-amino-4-deoxy-L-arabinose transferase-like glycosyltransferase
MMCRLLLLLLFALPVFAWRIARPGFSDTEGMFAEPAREMVLTGDWVTPRMNGEPFLTKPPFMYWLPAALFTLAGPTEYARLWPALAAAATVVVTGVLGAELFGEAAGVAAAVVLATSLGFLMEARLLRADMLLVLSVTVALYCFVRLRRGGGIATAMAFWASIGVGLLDKGFLALLLPGSVIAAAEIAAGELRPRTLRSRLRALHTAPGVALVAAIAVPWYGLAVLRNPGFLWDSIVNQQIMRFFNEKLPGDFTPDSLGFFWAMFFVRTLPWSLLLPAALLHGWRGLDYYTGRYVFLLSPANWVPPVYLVGRTDRLFTGRVVFERAWRHGPAALVSDDVPVPRGEAEIVPAPYTLVARRGARVLLWSGGPEDHASDAKP